MTTICCMIWIQPLKERTRDPSALVSMATARVLFLLRAVFQKTANMPWGTLKGITLKTFIREMSFHAKYYELTPTRLALCAVTPYALSQSEHGPLCNHFHSSSYMLFEPWAHVYKWHHSSCWNIYSTLHIHALLFLCDACGLVFTGASALTRLHSQLWAVLMQ